MVVSNVNTTQYIVSNENLNKNTVKYDNVQAEIDGEIQKKPLYYEPNSVEEITIELDKIFSNSEKVMDEGKIMKVAGLVPLLGYAEDGEVTIIGKIFGYDETMSEAEVESLRIFIESNAILGLSGGIWIDDETTALLDSTMSIDEFKTKWLEYKAVKEESWQKNLEEFFKKFNQQTNQTQELNTSQTNTEESTSKKTFTPIQTTSKNDIYKDTGYFKFKDLLKNQQDLDMLSILFNSIKNDKNFSNTNNNINNTLLNLMRTNILNGLDIKA
ncbi:hypothetical protein [Campylobacter troglodytis]|uniref:hypothetical protein n=1 Tax=Campylobacter troglodytis TaxID=654363 RepID=UPI00115A0D89|nr:hypothetical protein [Campylobacter troglodytis]TQR53023.1 hypothetical protein DMC01_12325 [Campylobacter troglodytis]